MQIDLLALRAELAELEKIKQKLRFYAAELEEARFDIGKWGREEEILKQIRNETERIEEQLQSLDRLKKTLDKIIWIYDRAENHILWQEEELFSSGFIPTSGIKDFGYLTSILRDILGN